jgi:YbbR domain-containing protein
VASIFRRLTENWKLKTLAFALAVLLWIVVSAEQVTTQWIGVPLEVQVTDPEYQLDRASLPREVEVRFSGAGRNLLDVAVRRPPLRLTVTNVVDEVVTATLDPRMVQVPAQIAVSAMDVRPSMIQLEFTRMETRVLPVSVRTEDLLGAGWALVDRLEVQPEEIRVSGPAERLTGLREVATQPFDITPADTVFERIVALDTTQLRGLDLSARRVRVAGRIDRVVERSVPNVPVDVGPGIAITPDRVEVRLRGPQRTVVGVQPETFRVAVAIDEIPTRIPPEGVPVPLRVDRLPLGVSGTVIPSQVRLFPAAVPEGAPPIGVPQGPPPPAPAEADTIPATPPDAG